MKKLSLDFYKRDTCIVARDLIGKILVFKNQSGMIMETEAYRGADDPASHAYKGPTPRSQIMFQEAGRTYIYLIYGMYYCLNIVTEPEGMPGAVLIRGLKIGDLHLNGPGKLCRYLGLTQAYHGIDVVYDHDFYLTEGVNHLVVQTGPRVGIKQGCDKWWRFYC